MSYRGVGADRRPEWQPVYLTALCQALSNTGNLPQARQLAGLLLKNALSSRDDQAQLQLVSRWTLLDKALHQNIEALLLQTLNDNVREIRSTAALVRART